MQINRSNIKIGYLANFIFIKEKKLETFNLYLGAWAAIERVGRWWIAGIPAS